MIPESYAHNAIPYIKDRTAVASAARTTSGTQVITGVGWAEKFTFVLGVTAAATDVGDTLNVYIQRKLPNGSYDDVVSFTQVLGNGGAKTFVADVYGALAAGDERAPTDAALAVGTVVNAWIGDTFRVKWVVVDGDADASFTFSVTYSARG